VLGDLGLQGQLIMKTTSVCGNVAGLTFRQQSTQHKTWPTLPDFSPFRTISDFNICTDSLRMTERKHYVRLGKVKWA